MNEATRCKRARAKSLRCQAAALRRVTAPEYDGRAATESMRAAYWARLDEEADPLGRLSDEERRARAKRIWRARMSEARANKLAPKRGGRRAA